MTYIACTVTTDLNYDQRMQRICGALVEAGYDVSLSGCSRHFSKPLEERTYRQFRIACSFKRGFLHYAEYNLKLYFHLISLKPHAVYSVDLDTLCAGAMYSIFYRKPLIFDSHEFFTELPELAQRPFKKAIWGIVAKLFVKRASLRFTVAEALGKVLSSKYNVPFEVVRNVPLLENKATSSQIDRNQPSKIILYQGALNTGRGLEQMIEAMPLLPDNVVFWLAGEGDLSATLREQSNASEARDRIRFLGYVMPEQLKEITQQAWLGYNLLENKGLNYYYSLANKFFDYAHAGVPSLNPDFPEYRNHLSEFETGVLVKSLSHKEIASVINALYNDRASYERLVENCWKAKSVWNWEQEEKKLIKSVKKILSPVEKSEI